MAQLVREIMAPSPTAVTADSPISETAEVMRTADIGDVMVVDNGRFHGIVTDRDIVVRAVARGLDVAHVPVGDICSRELIVIDADAPLEQAVSLMRERAIRRLPVIEDKALVGVLSIGDLALDRQPDSVLADISAARANQ